MVSDRELMQQALNVLENRAPDHTVTKALRERLAQPEQYQRPQMRRATREEKIDKPGVYWVPVEQEPVAWQWLDTGTFRKSLPASAEPGAWRPLYTTPPVNTIANSEAIPEQISEPQHTKKYVNQMTDNTIPRFTQQQS